MANKQVGFGFGALLILVGAVAYAKDQPSTAPVSLDPGKLSRIRVVDERSQSYNVEMAEVTGGYFWKPYGKDGHTAAPKPASALAIAEAGNPNSH